MKEVYTVKLCYNSGSDEIISTENEAEARKCYEECIKDITPVDVSGWNDHDRGWSDVARYELEYLVFGDDEEDDGFAPDPIDWQGLEESDYFDCD